jgi:serine protease
MNRAVVAAAAATTFAVTGLAGAANTALAARPSPSHPAGHISGIVPSHGLHAAKPRSSGSNLSYHGGPVEHNGTVYLLFWNPDNAGTWAPGYQTIVEKYFTDVAAATSASAQTNVYWAATQYTDGSGAVGIPTTVGDPGGITDNGNGVVSGCSDTGTVLCVTDGQIQSEVSTQVSANHWNVGPNDEVFVFTAKGIGSCAGNQCAFSYYCAYHSWFGSGSSVQLYANMPYADTNPSACGTGEQPNGNDADDTINVTID